MKSILLVITCIFCGLSLLAQLEYNMSDNYVEDCNGILMDSDANTQQPGDYAHNEHFVFTICPPDADSIEFAFFEFAIEECCDFISIFDGADTNGTLLGRFSGTNMPGPFLATSGCLTIKFTSDKDVSNIGWRAQWTTILKEPIPPNIISTSGASCFSNTFTITLDKGIPCDSVYAALFAINGPSQVEVSNASSVNCSGGKTDQIELSLNPSFSDNGTYNINYLYRFTDICGEFWEFDVTGTTEVTDCPLSAEIIASSDTICEGDCVQLTGDASGGDANTYNFNWNNGIPSGSGPHTVCPVSTTIYQLTVTDASPSPQDVATKTIVVVPRPDAGSNQTMCRFDPPVTLNGSPSGGHWEGSGIVDPVAGRFDPDSGIIGINKVWYKRNGCADTIEVEVLLSWAGPPEAACPGASPFQVQGGFPAGGTWSGSNITSGGTFDPSSAGSYTVTYTAPNGCQHSKNINVQNIQMEATDTTCTSLTSYDLDAHPYGGRWSGTGITNIYTGEFNPSAAGNGTHTITYTLNGCSQTMDVYVQDINARWNRVYCPSEPLDTLPSGIPSGGYWTGSGIVDSVIGTYNPDWRNGRNYNDWVVYHLEGCVDSIRIFGRQTRIYDDSLQFCESDSFLYLNWAGVRRTPGNGQWIGPGIIDPDYPGRFDPKVAGPGVHQLIYDANTCADTMTMIVHALPSMPGDITVCNKASSFPINATPAGGVWHGNGITDSLAGIFDPQLTGNGQYTVDYTSPQGCLDSMNVVVEPLQSVSIDPIGSFFCYSDTTVALSATPKGGSFSGPGIVDTTFNPIMADSGNHTIFYQHGTGECAVSDSFTVMVGEQLVLTTNLASDSICFGEISHLAAYADGGTGANYQYSWSHNQGSEDSIIATPTSSTTYTVTLNDGCTQPVSTAIYVHVYPEIKTSFTSGPKVCYGEESFVAVRAQNGGNYQFEWQTNPPQITDTLFDVAGDYFVDITDLNSGCEVTGQATIDGYSFVKAQFSINPNDDCVTILEPGISIIDNSVGGLSGTLDFGDGRSIPYNPGEFVTHRYADTGHYILRLYIENEGGCADSFEASFCVEPAATLFAPTAFTPDGDGLNDQFKPRGIGIENFQMMVFNRWGEKIFETNDIEQGWDGRYKGEMAPNDAYTYLIIYKDMTSPVPKRKKGTFALIR